MYYLHTFSQITEEDAAQLVAKEREMLAKLKLLKSQERSRLNEKLAAKLKLKVLVIQMPEKF